MQTKHQRETELNLSRLDELFLLGQITEARALARRVSHRAMVEYYAHQIEASEAREIIMVLLGKVNKIKS